MEQYITEILVLIVGAFVGWFPNRKKQKVDTKQIEVDVLEKALQVLNKDVVQPLRDNLELLRVENSGISKELKTLKNAVNKMYTCRSLSNCPIRIELQKPDKNNGRKGSNAKPTTNRQREPSGGENDTTGDSAADDGEDQPHA